MTTVVVSPHLDDAVLSLPAWLASAAGRERVVVLTVFSEGDAAYPQRRAEDHEALTRLGVEALHLGLRDAPQRRGQPPSFRSLVLAENDPADERAVLAALVPAIAGLAADAVLLPLAVGEHIDHRIVHAAHPRLAGRVGFYEDRPYALVQHAVQARMARIGAGPGPAAGERDAYRAALRRARYVHSYVPAAQREGCVDEVVARWIAASGARLRLAREVYEFTEDGVLARAGAAVRAYASQLPALFDDDSIDELFAARPYVERIHWRLAPA